MKRLLVACEESQRVTAAFRARGWEAYSCDIQEPSGGHPEWHILGDCLPLLNGNCTFRTMDGVEHHIDGRWDMLIAHPPCTFLAVSGNRWFNVERYGQKAVERIGKRKQAADFFMKFVIANAGKKAIENPVGWMSTHYKKPDQIIHPWMFGHGTTKKTCLWLYNLPKLAATNIVPIDPNDVYCYVSKTGKIKHDSKSRSFCAAQERGKHRSKTFWGIANAMAEQWG